MYFNLKLYFNLNFKLKLSGRLQYTESPAAVLPRIFVPKHIGAKKSKRQLECDYLSPRVYKRLKFYELYQQGYMEGDLATPKPSENQT